jgi:hypothetical protein
MNRNGQTPGFQRIRLGRIILLLFLLSSCSPNRVVTQSASAVPTETRLTRTATPLPTATQSVDELIAIIEVSDPASPTYDPGSAAYAQFPEALKKLAALDASSNNAASMIAYAMGFPRPDSVLAAQAIISLGRDTAGTDFPALIGYLTNKRADIRLYSLIVLSITGHNGSCSLGQVGPLLRDPDPYVRTAAALAIQGITGVVLIPNDFMITPDNLSPTPVAADTPEGKITDAARTWWDEQGSQVNWHPSYDLCDP